MHYVANSQILFFIVILPSLIRRLTFGTPHFPEEAENGEGVFGSGAACFSLSTLKFRRWHICWDNQLPDSGEEWKIALIDRLLMKEGKLAVDLGFYLNHWGLHRDSPWPCSCGPWRFQKSLLTAREYRVAFWPERAGARRAWAGGTETKVPTGQAKQLPAEPLFAARAWETPAAGLPLFPAFTSALISTPWLSPGLTLGNAEPERGDSLSSEAQAPLVDLLLSLDAWPSPPPPLGPFSLQGPDMHLRTESVPRKCQSPIFMSGQWCLIRVLFVC